LSICHKLNIRLKPSIGDIDFYA